MTISAIDTGSVLYFSHDEVKSFSSRQGVLFFVLPRLPEETAVAPLC